MVYVRPIDSHYYGLRGFRRRGNGVSLRYYLDLIMRSTQHYAVVLRARYRIPGAPVCHFDKPRLTADRAVALPS